jgi:hypothetical protein
MVETSVAKSTLEIIFMVRSCDDIWSAAGFTNLSTKEKIQKQQIRRSQSYESSVLFTFTGIDREQTNECCWGEWRYGSWDRIPPGYMYVGWYLFKKGFKRIVGTRESYNIRWTLHLQLLEFKGYVHMYTNNEILSRVIAQCCATSIGFFSTWCRATTSDKLLLFV